MVVGLRGAPVRYGAVRVALRDPREGLQRAGIPEVMEQREGSIEVGRDSWRARGVHVRVPQAGDRAFRGARGLSVERMRCQEQHECARRDGYSHRQPYEPAMASTSYGAI